MLGSILALYEPIPGSWRAPSHKELTTNTTNFSSNTAYFTPFVIEHVTTFSQASLYGTGGTGRMGAIAFYGSDSFGRPLNRLASFSILDFSTTGSKATAVLAEPVEVQPGLYWTSTKTAWTGTLPVRHCYAPTDISAWSDSGDKAARWSVSSPYTASFADIIHPDALILDSGPVPSTFLRVAA